MKVKRLKMQAFRGIDDLKLDFHETEPTVFIGINGVGKSSILDCIALLLWIPIREIENYFAKKGRPGLGRNRFVTNSPSFSSQNIMNGFNESNEYITISWDSKEANWSITIPPKEDWVLSGGTFSGSKDRGKFMSNKLEEIIAVTENIKHHLKTNSEANLPLAVYYPVNRAVLNIPLEIPEEQFPGQIAAYERSLTGVQIGFDSFFQWFRTVEDVENEELRDDPTYRDKRLEAVRQAIYSLLGEEFSSLRVRRSPLRMTITKQGEELIVNQLSDGEKCLLAMAGDLARRLAIANPGLSNPLEGSGVVLIDEIELHLHPKWQREIIPALTRTFPNCQFIVTTHSPQVISEVKPEGIYILEKTEEGVIARRPESSFGRDSNRILEDLMGVPERPLEIKESLLELFRLIDKGELDAARELRQRLANEIGADEPEFVRADVFIRRKEVLNR